MSKPNFLDFMNGKKQVDEAFNSAPYELTFGKKNAGDIFFTFVDEDEKEFRIQFYTPQGLGKNVRQVFIGQKKGSVYPDAISRFKNPMRVIASMIEATKQYLATPLGKTIDGFAVNFSKKALDRGMVLIPKIIRQSGLKQKLNVMDLTYAPVPDRGYVWLVRKGKDPAQVFDGPKMQGITWDDPDKVGDVPVQNNTPDVGVGSNNTGPADSNTTAGANSIEQLKDSGFIARVLGIVDTHIDQKASYLPGESIRKMGVGRYQTKGGLVINVRFDEVKNGSLKYSVLSELGNDSGTIEGDARRVANEIMETITYVAELQYKGEWDVVSVPTNAPYPVSNTSYLYGRTTIETSSFSLRIPDAIIKRVKLGSLIRLDLKNYPTRGRHSIEVMPEGNDNTLMLKDSSGKIYGSIDLNAVGEDVIDTKLLKIPSNAGIFGKTVHGFSVLWKNVWFPKGTKYVDSNVATNVTFLHDKGKASITPMIIQKGKPVNNPRSYEIPLTKDSIQQMLDGWSDRYALIARELSTVGSPNYNPMGLFLDQIVVDENGNVKWGNTDLGVSSNSGKLLDAISRETDRLEEEGKNKPGGKKTGVDLATYADSIRDNAPQGRDLDWGTWASRDGQTLNLEWDITFRRNTMEGAYQEFKAQIDRANQYLQTVYQDAKAKGYNPTEPNLVTLESARRGDEMTFQNGGSAYSEYEQTIGGNMQIKI